MTRFWMRNFTSRNDSRTGAWLVRRPWAGALGGPPAGALGRLAPGTPGAVGAPDAPGRALSIRFSRDIAYTPSRPERPTAFMVMLIAMRKAISSGSISGPRSYRPATDHRPRTEPSEGCPGRPAPPDWRGRKVRHD